MHIDAMKIAQEYAYKNGKDTVRLAGERNGYKYFHVFLWATRNHKLGIQQYIKISRTGKITSILSLKEIMWAGDMEVLLNNL